MERSIGFSGTDREHRECVYIMSNFERIARLVPAGDDSPHVREGRKANRKGQLEELGIVIFEHYREGRGKWRKRRVREPE